MLNNDHEKFLDLIVKYYNAREDWLENNTRANHSRYRKVMKELKLVIASMLNNLQVIYHEKLKDNLDSREKTGFIPKKRPPKDIDSISSSE
jgi:hypothetical protein